MNDTELDRLATRAGAAVRDEAIRIADSHTALAELMAAEAETDVTSEARGSAPTAVVTLDRRGRARSARPWLPWVAALTAAAATVTVIAVADRSGDSIQSVDEPTTVTSQPTPATTTPATTAPASLPPTVAPSPTAVPESLRIAATNLGSQVERAVVTSFAAVELAGGVPPVAWAPVAMFGIDEAPKIVFADTASQRWLIHQGDEASSIPFGDVTVIGRPILGFDGLVYAPVRPTAGDPRPRIAAYRVPTFDEVATHEFDEANTQWNQALLDTIIGTAARARLGTPSVTVEEGGHVVTVALSGVRRSYQLPDNWFADQGPIGLTDGSSLVRVSARNGEVVEVGLMELRPDGSWRVGKIGRAEMNVAAGFDAELTAIGLIQLEAGADGGLDVVLYQRPTESSTTQAVAPTPPPDADPLTGFSIPEPVTLDDVPRLLPTRMAPGATETTRNDWADSTISIAPRFEQLWARADATGVVDAIVITTAAFQWSLPGGGTPADIANWTQAEFSPMAPGYESVDLLSPSGGARVWAAGLTRDEVAAIAEGLRYAPDGGPLTSPALAGWTPIAGQWTLGAAGRTTHQRTAAGVAVTELSVSSGMGPGYSGFPLLGPDDTDGMRIVDVNGATALLAHNSAQSILAPYLTWAPQPGVLALMGILGTADELLAVARSLTEVDQTTWEASSTEHVPAGDGCPTMFGC